MLLQVPESTKFQPHTVLPTRGDQRYVAGMSSQHAGLAQDYQLAVSRLDNPGRRWTLDELECEHERGLAG